MELYKVKVNKCAHYCSDNNKHFNKSRRLHQAKSANPGTDTFV